MKILSFKGDKYMIHILIIEEMNRNLMKFVQFHLYPWFVPYNNSFFTYLLHL